MSKAQQRKFLNTADDHQREIVRIIRDLSRHTSIDRVWSDWIEICAIALARVDLEQAEQREQRYLEIVKTYERAALEQLVDAFAHLVMAYEKRVEDGTFGDVLGSTFMMLDMGNDRAGQFFTPYEISRFMGQLLMGSDQDLASLAHEQGFIRLMEPACGAGGMIVAAAHALHAGGTNYQRAMHATAIDIDQRCVHMTFVQLALLHVPAEVIHGNALSGERWSHWYTPAHVLGGWGARLRRRDAQASASTMPATDSVQSGDVGPLLAPPPDAPITTAEAAQRAAATGQLFLF